jgi:rod shape-determining protein MreD
MSAGAVLKTALLLWLAVLLQATLLSGLGAVSPDLVLVAVVAVALLRGAEWGAIAGFCAGLMLDVVTLSPLLGASSLVLAVAGYWIGRYGETTGRDRRYAPYLSVAVMTVLVAFATLALYVMLQQSISAQRVLLHELPGRLIFDLVLTAPLFRIAVRLLRRESLRERTPEVRLLA